MDWTEAKTQIAPLLAHPDHWPRIRHQLEKREVNMLALVGENPLVPGDPGRRRRQRLAHRRRVDWTRPDPVDHALEMLLDEIDTPGGTPGIHPPEAAPRERHREEGPPAPLTHGIGPRRKHTRGPRSTGTPTGDPGGALQTLAFADPDARAPAAPMSADGGNSGGAKAGVGEDSQPAGHQTETTLSRDVMPQPTQGRLEARER